MRAQGTIEYLVILAVIVVISLVVVSLMATSATPASQISETQSKLYWETQPISITDAVADRNGDAIMTLAPRETVTVTEMEIDGKALDVPDTKIFGGEEVIIMLDGLGACTGTTTTYTINRITGETENGLPVTVSEGQIVITCTTDVSEESIVSDDYVSAIPPTVTLNSPSQGETVSSFNFSFTVTDTEDIESCTLNMDGAPTTATVASPAKGTPQTLCLQDLSLAADQHEWSVECTNSGSLVGESPEREFTNPYATLGMISACPATLGTPNAYYWLEGNLASSGTCITITDDNIGVDGTDNEYSITGDSTGYGIDASSSNSPAHTGVSVNNTAISNFSTDIYAVGGISGGTGQAGGGITLKNATLSTINASGGNGSYDGWGDGAPGGAGGAITATDSSITTITSKGGNGGNTYMMGSGGNGGRGGTITLQNTPTETINAYGGSRGTGWDSVMNGAGGSGGTVTLTGSDTTTISSYGNSGRGGGSGGTVSRYNSDATALANYGGNGQPFPGAGGVGGTITIENAEIPTVSNYGGAGETGANGGTINATNLTATTISNYGGDAWSPTRRAGSGGTVALADSDVGSLINRGGYGQSGGGGGPITISGSTITTIENYGIPTNYYISSGASAGPITISESVIGTILNSGGDANTSYYNGGNGGDINADGSTITEIYANGGATPSAFNGGGGNGGDMIFSNTTITTIRSKGGLSGDPGGDGGDLAFDPCPDPKPSVQNSGGAGTPNGADGTIAPADCHQ